MQPAQHEEIQSYVTTVIQTKFQETATMDKENQNC